MENSRQRTWFGLRSWLGGDPLSKTSDNLRSLLDDECFLLMVFEHLVEHGLQNCRLVCQRWREACKQFPVQFIRLKRWRPEMFDAFPNATSVSLGNYLRIPVAELFENLSSLNRLKSLTFHTSDVFYDDGAPPCLQLMAQLTNLSIFNGNSPVPDNLMASLKYLTNLTSLLLYSRSPRRQLDPFIELQKIRRLEGNVSTFFNDSGAFLFPSATSLTRLCFGSSSAVDLSLLLSAEVIVIFASSLKHIALNIQKGDDMQGVYTPMMSLTNLETLALSRPCSYSVELFEVLSHLNTLTRLVLKYHRHLDPAIQESIARCRGLKALDATGTCVRGHEDDGRSLVPYLTQLKEIAVDHRGKDLADLGRLKLLERLYLRVLFEKNCSLDEALECMPSLQIIDVQFIPDCPMRHDQWLGGKVRLSGHALSAIHHLKSVSLRDVHVDETFFHVLASKTGLTALEFISSRFRGYSRHFVCEVNQLRNLEELVLDMQENYDMRDLLSPEDLPKLKRLRINCTADEVAIVRRKFNQSIRRVFVNNDKRSAWRSRLSAS